MKILKKIVIVYVFFCIAFMANNSYATEEVIEAETEALGISSFLEEAESYTEETFPDLDLKELLTGAVKGEIDLGFFKTIFLKLIGTEVTSAIKLMVSVLVIIIINSVCKAIIENLGNEDTAKITYFLQYIIVVTLVMASFNEIVSLTKDTIEKVTSFMNLLIPLFITLMLTTGCITTTSIVQPVLIFFINFMGTFCSSLLIPMLLIAIVLTVISNLSDKVQISGIAKFLKSTIVWVLGIVLTVFTCLLSLEGTLSSSVDGLTAKTAKVTISAVIPVVGKILGDTAETVIGCSNILKNTVGFIGVIIILGIVLEPIIKIAIFTLCFKFTAMLGETIADEKIVKLISGLADGYKILLGILCSVSVMFVIGITLVMKITNSSIMYR